MKCIACGFFSFLEADLVDHLRSTHRILTDEGLQAMLGKSGYILAIVVLVFMLGWRPSHKTLIFPPLNSKNPIDAASAPVSS